VHLSIVGRTKIMDKENKEDKLMKYILILAGTWMLAKIIDSFNHGFYMR
jgi:hypothetical protein